MLVFIVDDCNGCHSAQRRVQDLNEEQTAALETAELHAVRAIEVRGLDTKHSRCWNQLRSTSAVLHDACPGLREPESEAPNGAALTYSRQHHAGMDAATAEGRGG